MPRASGPPGAFRLLLCPDGGKEKIVTLGNSNGTLKGAKQNVKRWCADVGERGRILVQEKEGEGFVTRAMAHVRNSETVRWEGT